MNPFWASFEGFRNLGVPFGYLFGVLIVRESYYLLGLYSGFPYFRKLPCRSPGDQSSPPTHVGTVLRGAGLKKQTHEVDTAFEAGPLQSAVSMRIGQARVGAGLHQQARCFDMALSGSPDQSSETMLADQIWILWEMQHGLHLETPH